MQKINLIIIMLLYLNTTTAQIFKGKIFVHENNIKTPIEYATIKQLNTNIGTFSNSKGYFEIKIDRNINDSIEISYIGYQKQIFLYKEKPVECVLEKDLENLESIEIKGRKNSLEFSTLQTLNVEKITLKEIKRAACCNLSESFETNATVDAKYSDALSGAKQIQLLGLSGIYTQYLRENIPSLLGMQNALGLAYVPGTWLSEISISKGVGSVINGMDGIAGSLNYELIKPDCKDVTKKIINIYTGSDARLEANLVLPFEINEHLRMITMLHSSGFYRKMDNNNDQFIDMPIYTQINALHRWDYLSKNEIEFQGGLQFLHDNRKSGNDLMHNKNHLHYIYRTQIINKGLNAWTKLGKIHNADKNNSTGIQLSGSWYNSNATFDKRILNLEDLHFASNIIHHRQIKNKLNEITFGLNFQYFKRIGFFTLHNIITSYQQYSAFAEYSFTPNKKINAITGFRIDYLANTMIFTPRFHFKYNFNDNNILRLSLGKSSRRSDFINDNFNLLSNNRYWNLQDKYSLENAWTGGLNYTSKFKIRNMENSIRFDFYRTNFQNKNIVHYTASFDTLFFYSNKNAAFAYSAQLEWQQILSKNIEYRMAIRFEKSNEKWDSIWQNRILYSPFKCFSTFSFISNNKKWKLDFTAVYYNKKRQMPLINNDNGNKVFIQKYTIPYWLMHTQLSYNIKKWDFYIGIENILNFKQQDIIQNYNTPESITFNASNIWGPINGRQGYIGLRYLF